MRRSLCVCVCADGGLPFWKKLVAGATAGSIGAAIATPTDVLKVHSRACMLGLRECNGVTKGRRCECKPKEQERSQGTRTHWWDS